LKKFIENFSIFEKIPKSRKNLGFSGKFRKISIFDPNFWEIFRQKSKNFEKVAYFFDRKKNLKIFDFFNFLGRHSTDFDDFFFGIHQNSHENHAGWVPLLEKREETALSRQT